MHNGTLYVRDKAIVVIRILTRHTTMRSYSLHKLPKSRWPAHCHRRRFHMCLGFGFRFRFHFWFCSCSFAPLAPGPMVAVAAVVVVVLVANEARD